MKGDVYEAGKEKKMNVYINFCFKNIEYDDDFIRGKFEASDSDVYCEFEYNRNTEKVRIWNSNQPIKNVVPLPIWWLQYKLKENGKLNSEEWKISY